MCTDIGLILYDLNIHVSGPDMPCKVWGVLCRIPWHNTWSCNKVRELATVCFPWQHWIKALVWFDNVDISAFHSCVVVELWHSLSEWHLLLSAFWCAAARMSELELEQRTNIKFLVKLGKSGNEIREMLVQVYGDNAMKKTAVHKWVKRTRLLFACDH